MALPASQTKAQAVATIKGMNLYIEDSLSHSFIQDVFNGKKKLLPTQVMVPHDENLLKYPFLNAEQLYDALSTQASWISYLPNKFDDCKRFVCNLINSSSGLAFENALNDIIQSIKYYNSEVKKIDKGELETILEVKDSRTYTDQNSQYMAERCLQYAKRHSRKINGFKISDRKAIKVKSNAESELKDAALALAQWTPETGTQDNLKRLLLKLYERKVINKVTVQMVSCCIQQISANRSRLKMSVEFRLSTLEQSNEDPLFRHYLQYVQDDDFVKVALTTVKTKVCRAIKHYSLSLNDLSSLSEKVKLQKPAIAHQNCCELRDFVLSLDDAAYRAIRELGLQQPSEEGLTAKSKASNLQEYDVNLEQALYICECCLKRKLTKYFSLLQCLHVICAQCYMDLESDECFICQEIKAVIRQGRAQEQSSDLQQQQQLNSDQLSRLRTLITSDNYLAKTSKYQPVFDKKQDQSLAKELKVYKESYERIRAESAQSEALIESNANEYIERMRQDYEQTIAMMKLQLEHLQELKREEFKDDGFNDRDASRISTKVSRMTLRDAPTEQQTDIDFDPMDADESSSLLDQQL